MVDLAMWLVSASWRFWQMRGHISEGRNRADTVMQLSDGLTDVRSPCCLLRGAVITHRLERWYLRVGVAGSTGARETRLFRSIPSEFRQRSVIRGQDLP